MVSGIKRKYLYTICDKVLYMEGIKLDLKDKKLLYELDMHARQPNSQLAKKVGLSKQAVQYRISRLQEKGIIKGFYPVINVPKLSYL